MNKKNGFAPIVGIMFVASALLIGSGFYFVVVKKTDIQEDRGSSDRVATSSQDVSLDSGFDLAPLAIVGTATTSGSKPIVAPVSVGAKPLTAVGAKDCKASIDCLIEAAVACRPATAVTTNSLPVFSLIVTTKIAHEIKGLTDGSCAYQAKTVDLQYATTDTSAAGRQAVEQAKQYGSGAIGTVQSCNLSAKELVKRLNNLKKGIASSGAPDPYCTNTASEQRRSRTTLFAQPGGSAGVILEGGKKVTIKYERATETSATLTIAVGGTSKMLTLDLRKEVVFSGVGFMVTSLEPSDIFPKEKKVGIELVEVD